MIQGNISSNYQNNLSFKGATEALEQQICNKPGEVRQLINCHPEDDSFVGHLDEGWVEKLPKKNRDKSIKRIYQAFREAAETIRAEGDTKVASVKAQEILENELKNTGVLRKENDVKLDFLGEGLFGKAFKLDIDDNPTVIKVFKESSSPWQKLVNRTSKAVGHGALFEINRNLFWTKNTPNSQMDIGFKFGDLKSKFMLVDYIDESTPPPARKIDVSDYGIALTDVKPSMNYNIKNGYVIDHGGEIVSNKYLATNKIARKTFKEIKSLPKEDRLERFLEIQENEENKPDKAIGLLLSMRQIPRNDRKKIPEDIVEQLYEDADINSNKKHPGRINRFKINFMKTLMGLSLLKENLFLLKNKVS